MSAEGTIPREHLRPDHVYVYFAKDLGGQVWRLLRNDEPEAQASHVTFEGGAESEFFPEKSMGYIRSREAAAVFYHTAEDGQRYAVVAPLLSFDPDWP